MKIVAQSSLPHPLPPGPASFRFLGDMLHAQADPLGYFLKLGIEHNGLARFRAGFWDVYLVAHPDAISSLLRDHYTSYSKNTFTYKMIRSVSGEGLLTLDGDAWHERRRMMQPIFSKERITALDGIVISATTEMLNQWEYAAKAGKNINLIEQINELTLIIAAQAFLMWISERVTNCDRQSILFLSATRSGFVQNGLHFWL